MSKKKKLIFIALFAFLLSFFLSVFLDGLTVQYMWNWFLVPLGMKELGFLQAMGVAMFFSYVTYHFYEFKRNDEIEAVYPTIHIVVRPLVTLGLGWLVHFLIENPIVFTHNFF